MSIAAINEQLLRAIGVGIALVDDSSLSVRFHNEKFAEWFGAPSAEATLGELFPDIDMATLRADLQSGRCHSVELSVKPTFADAILDRLVHNAYRIALDGPSLRKDRTDHAVEDAG